MSNPLHFGRAERALGAGSETLSIQQRSDLSVGVLRRQGSDSSDDHRIRPAQLVHPPGARDFEDRAGLGLPPNGYSNHGLFTRECHIFDQITQQRLAVRLERRRRLSDLR